MGKEYPAGLVRRVLGTVVEQCIDAQHIPLLFISTPGSGTGEEITVKKLEFLSTPELVKTLERALEWAKQQE